TNRDSISLGLVAGIKDMREKQKSPHNLLNTFKDHTVIQDTLKVGEVVEYYVYVVSSGDKRAMTNENYKVRLLLCGESANLLMNAGKAIQGMDFAMRSGILGAETIVKAKNNGDFSSAMLKEYRTSLNNSHVMKDINNFQDAVHMLHNPTMYKD